MKEVKQVAVVIPFYKSELTELEVISLKQCLNILSGYPIIAIKPTLLDISYIQKGFEFSRIHSYTDSYFDGIQGYNSLMLSTEFYDSFMDFEYILIHQLDAFVFRDELSHWCDKGYDYIGAPWLKRLPNPDFVKEWKTRINTRYHIFRNTFENGLPSDRQFDNQVGNGGFSLRRVKKFRDLTKKYKEKIQEYQTRKEHQFHEDVFWSIEMNRKWKQLRVPNYQIALLFSFENRLDQSMMHTKNLIPFGCHAWDKYLDFWRPYIEAFGYKIGESKI